MRVSFTVPGRPRPQGSKRAAVNRHTGRPYMVEQSAGLPEWRGRVTAVAYDAMEGPPADGPVRLSLAFQFRRPKSHYRTGRYSHLLRADAPSHLTKPPDIDKLVRAVLDSLTGVMFVDDGQVTMVSAVKRYGESDELGVMAWAEWPVEREAAA